jgi:threonine synthase
MVSHDKLEEHKMDPKSWLRCINGCDIEYPVFDVTYYCEKCGGLLEVAHDLSELKKRSGLDWKELFENRSIPGETYQQSGVWNYQEWVMPGLDRHCQVTLGEGRTPLVHSEKLGREIGVPDLWIKMSGTSHTGSFKDLGMTVLVSAVLQMIREGTPIRAVAAASTGDTSASLAAYAAAAGIPSVILLPRGKISTAQLIQPLANGALVLSLDTDFDGCMEVVKEITRDPEIYLANSLNSLRIEGQKTVGMEIVQQLKWEVPDWIVIPAGNLGNVSALGSGFRMMKELGLIRKLPRIACAQAENANPLYLSFLSGFEEYQPVEAKKTAASAIQIGHPVSYPRAVRVLREYLGVVGQASEKELAEAAARADRAGLYTCPQTGVALAVLKKLAAGGQISKDDRVVVISTAHGLKFTKFKLDYHQGGSDAQSEKFANQILEISPSVDAVKEVLETKI